MNRLLRRPLLATACLVLGTLMFQAWSWHLETVRLRSVPPPQAGGETAIVVELPFVPETFNIQRLQDAGRLVRIEGDRAWLRGVTAPRLRALARLYWIRRIEPWNGT